MSRDLERFNRLVSELLEISGYDAGAASLDLTEVQVGQFLNAAARAAGPIPVRLPFDAEQLVIAIDKRRLARVMANLIDNAHRYGGGATAIVVERSTNSLRIVVEDEGAGVPETERIAIFDRFSRGISGGKRGDDGGTGLGLSLVQEDIRLHGGRVWVEPHAGGRTGARFVIELPLDQSEEKQ